MNGNQPVISIQYASAPSGFRGVGGMRAVGGAGMLQPAAYAGSPVYQQIQYGQKGPLMANSFTFTTAGPIYRATMGGCPQQVQAMSSPLQNYMGAFEPCGMGSPLGNPQCY